MISFKQYLSESFDKPLEYKRTVNTPDDVWYEITGRGIRVRFLGDGVLTYDLEFEKTSRVGSTASRYDLVGSPTNQMRVFSTIGAIIKDVVRDRKVSQLKFSSFSKRTEKAYAQFAQRIGKQLNGTVSYVSGEWVIEL